MTRVGQGMFGTVRRRVFPLNFPVAVKELEVPQSLGDRQPLSVIFSEVTSLEVVSAANACTVVHDYGCDGNSWWIVMEWCSSSLKAWRRSLVGSLDELMPQLLRVYKQVSLVHLAVEYLRNFLMHGITGAASGGCHALTACRSSRPES